MAQLGFIGLGNMGSRLAANWQTDFGILTVWDRTADKRQSACPDGATAMETIADLVAASQVIGIAVSDDAAIRDIYAALLQADLHDTLIIDFSTISPDTAVELAKQATAAGAQVIDAAMAGSTPQVESRQLTLLIGGDDQAWQAARQYVEPLGQKTVHMGPNGYGLKMKLCINALLGLGVQALAEALVLGQKLGLDKQAMAEALEPTAVMSPSMKAKLPSMVADDFDTVAFALRLMYKDLGLVLDQAQATNTPMPVTAAARQVAASAMSQESEVDFAAVARTMARQAGI